jgi:hypothetical protein
MFVTTRYACQGNSDISGRKRWAVSMRHPILHSRVSLWMVSHYSKTPPVFSSWSGTSKIQSTTLNPANKVGVNRWNVVLSEEFYYCSAFLRCNNQESKTLIFNAISEKINSFDVSEDETTGCQYKPCY